MFTNNTFVANHSLTSNGHSTFSIPNVDYKETEEIDTDLVLQAKNRKSDLSYYKPIEFQFSFNKTLKVKLLKISLRIGDVIDFVTRITGIKKLIIKWTNGNCGCEQRRKKFNNWFFIPFVKIWFDELDYDDKIYLQTKKNIANFSKATQLQNEETFYQKVRTNIIDQTANKHHLDRGNNVAYWPESNTSQPKPGGCGCGNNFKKTVTYL